MRLNDNEFPVVVEAYDNRTAETNDRFVAEQVVYSQVEIDNFTSRYAGMLIKARALNNEEVELRHHPKHYRRRSSGAGIWLFFIVLLLAVVAVGWYTGWIQRTFHINY